LDDTPTNDPPPSDITPTAYRDPVSGKLHLIWASSRYGDIIGGPTPIAPTTYPMYLYISSLSEPAGVPGVWGLSLPTRWWVPTAAANAFPDPANINDFFMPPLPGALGDLLPGTVKLTCPSVAINKANNQTWLFFGAEGYKHLDLVTTPQGNVNRTAESRVWCAELDDGQVQSATVSTISHDWTMPKRGIRGIVRSPLGAQPSLWAFWYGGSNEKWRMYYVANPDPAAANWSNEASLPVPNGLSWTAEPSPIFMPQVGGPPVEPMTQNLFDVVYAGYSTFHKNSDIYMSRYKPDAAAASPQQGGHWPMRIQPMPMRDVDWYNNGGSWEAVPVAGSVPYAVLRRDPARGIWYSRDVDWDTTAGLHVYVINGAVSEEVTMGTPVKDKETGSWAYTYDDPAQQTLKNKYRAVVVDPAAGTVKFLRVPAADSEVVASYVPRAYRLTTDSASDVSPYAFLDDSQNPRYDSNAKVNPFINCASAPLRDRLWVFWRRPASDKPGTGVHYKTYRYMVQLDSLAAPNRTTGELPVADVVDASGKVPAEIDWINKRLYFTADAAIEVTGGIPAMKEVWITYTDAQSGSHEDELHRIEFAEEVGQTAIGNLMVNEGQISAFRDPVEDKVWVFWTSTRSGSTDIYYETLSPRFYGME
jgi:hypothetical protein